MPKTRLISPGSIPNHKLLKNLQLQDNYISNDGGDEGIRIDNDGNIGIGTNDPDTPLDIKANTVDFVHLDRTANAGVDHVFKLSVGAGGFMGIGRDENDDLFIDENGKVGIGTYTPISRLTILDGATTGGPILTFGTKEASVVAGDVLGRINFYAPLESQGGDANLIGASIAAVAQASFSSTDNSTALRFYTGTTSDATAKTAVMSIDEDGFVGIGTQQPEWTLMVQGDNAQGTVSCITSDWGLGSTGSYIKMNPKSGSGNEIAGYIQVGWTGGTAGGILALNPANGKVGVNTDTPISDLEIRQGLSTVGAVLTLGTKEPTVVANDVLGRINFYAPLDTGTDSDEIGASIVAVAQDTFSDTVNATALEFQTGKSEVATTKMIIDEDGTTTLYPATVKVYEFGASAFKIYSIADTDDYFQIAVDTVAGGKTTFSTVQDDGGNTADMVFDPDGDITFNPGPTNRVFIENTTKTASGNFDTSLRITETLDMDSGADGDDVHYGIWYTQTQTDLTGWNSVYLMYLDGGTNKTFSVDNNAELACPSITINNVTEDIEPVLIDYDYTNTTGAVKSGLRIDVDRTGDVSSGIDVNYGQYTTVNVRGASVVSITYVGHRVNVVGDSGGTSKNKGIDIAVSGADTNYALITSGGNVGIGEASPQDTLEVNGTVLVKDALKFTQDDGNEFIDSQNDGYLDIGATTAIRLEQDTLVEGTKKLYFNDAGGEYISGDGTDLTITSGGRVTNTCGNTYKIDSGAGIILDSATGSFQMHGAGTTSEFSVANSAYAGMILGYRTVGIDAADDSYTLTTTFTVTDAAHKVKFVAQPSGVVEIFVSIFHDSTRRILHLGLSDNATYNSLDVTHEHDIYVPGGTVDELQINHYWVITGLTAGTAYEYWLGAKITSGTGGVLRWGGNVTGEYPPFIMKATALPAAVAYFAVYG